MTKLHKKNSTVVRRLLLLVVGMFGFGFALVPLYDVFCEVTGINGKTSNVAADIRDAQIDIERVLTIQFVASVKRGMPWEFRPSVSELKVHPGKIYKTTFYAHNLSNRHIVGQAIPSVAPGQAALYLNKTECFCFNQQPLDAHEEVEMPLVFFIDKDIPKHITTLTLSYSLFNISDRADLKVSALP